MKKHRWLSYVSLFLLLCFCACLCVGCGKTSFTLENTFEEYYEKNKVISHSELKGMAEDLAVLSEEEDAAFAMDVKDYADLLINDTKNEVVTSYHCFEKVYPASITKIMTALLILENGNLNDKITLKKDIILSEDGAVISTLSKGATVSVEEVLKTMLVKSANDCSVILAEYLSGDTETFVERMNERAKELGATHTHFVNPNGLHDDNHYTTAYDLYLIFKEVIKYDIFVDIVSMKDYTMTYTNRNGYEIKEYMQSTNHFLLNEYPVPDGVVLYGGKTGTTSMANSCLILLSENEKKERFISVVLGSKTKEDLYRSMTDLLEKINN